MKREQVNSIMQFGQRKLLVAAKTHIILFDDWRFIRAYNAQTNETIYTSE